MTLHGTVHVRRREHVFDDHHGGPDDPRAGAELGARAAVIGTAVMVIEHVLAPENVDRAVARQSRH